jgi:hypothetical protein
MLAPVKGIGARWDHSPGNQLQWRTGVDRLGKNDPVVAEICCRPGKNKIDKYCLSMNCLLMALKFISE